MKTALIFFRNAQVEPSLDNVNGVLSAFYSGGIKVDTVEILSAYDDLGFKRRLKDFRNTADNLIVCYSQSATFDIKGIIADEFDSPLIENQNAKKIIDTLGISNGVKYSDTFSFLPVDSSVIPNLKGPFQGFMVEDKEFSLVVLPEETEQLSVMCKGYVVPYFESKYGVSPKKMTLKYFGDVALLKKTLKEAEENFDRPFNYFLKTTYGDTAINIFFNEEVDKRLSDSAVRFVVERLKDNIYAEFDTTLGKRLYDILKLRKLRLSTAESFTGGRLISSVISNPGASEVIHEGVVSYSNNSKKKRLGVKDEDLKNFGAVSAKVAYQMALGLLVAGECDIAISTTGIAGPKSDNTEKPVGLCYIAVGMDDGIHSYKYVFNGDREEITETAKNTALFLAIKKLKYKN